MSTNARQRLAALSDQERNALARRLAGRRAPGGSPSIPRSDAAPDRLPLSFAQQRFWFLNELAPLNAAYTVGEVHRLRGPLDESALDRAITEIVHRHEPLRTTFESTDTGPMQRVAPPGEVVLARRDLSTEPNPASALGRALGEHLQTPWDLRDGPLFKAALWRLGDDDHVLSMLLHHIISDGWSKGVLVREFAELYEAFRRGGSSPLAPLPIRYRDFTLWQADWMRSPAADRQLEYWKARLADAPVLQLPSDGAGAEARGTHRLFALSASTTAALRSLAQREGVTLFMALLASLAALLARYSGQDDVVIGSPAANRGRPELEPMIGCFMNPVPFRIAVGRGTTFSALLAQAREVCLGAFANQEMPFDSIVRAVQPRRQPSSTPLFQSMLLLHNFWQGLRFGDGAAAATAFEPSAADLDGADGAVVPGDLVYPVALEVVDCGSRLLMYFEHANEYETVLDRLPQHFKSFLEAVIADPLRPVDAVTLTGVDERRRLLQEWRMSSPAPAFVSAHALLEQQAVRAPGAIAIESHAGRVTYAQLNAAANRMARHLRAQGVGAEDRVGVLLPRSSELVSTLVAVLKSGGAYVPLDAASPAARLRQMAEDARLVALVTSRALLDAAPELAAMAPTLVLVDEHAAAISAQSDSNLEVAIHAEQIAYVIFTSGSTGRPKGVAVRHGGLGIYAASCVERFALTARDRVLQFASVAFDTAAEEIYPTLAAGATLVLRTDAMLASATSFLADCRRDRITILDLPTAYWDELTARMAADALPAHQELRLVIIGGEKATPERARQWLALEPGVRLLNTYGPTETTIVATEAVLTGAGAPIGRPVPGAEVYVLDDRLEPVPAGVCGELYIGGSGLARGYLADPALTADRFVPDALGGRPGARLYKTGDLVRFLRDGTLEYRGRRDAQVKLRGFRIEPGEVQAALLSFPGVAQAFVTVRTDGTDVRRLVGYVTPSAGPVDPAALRRVAKERLPEYMVPAAIVVLEQFPLTSNGKVDERALPDPEGTRQSEQEYVAPATATERHVAAIWSEVLAVQRVSALDNFFDLGGHSMLAMRVASRLSRAAGSEVPVRIIFESRTLREQAARLDALTPAAAIHAVDAALEDEVVL